MKTVCGIDLGTQSLKLVVYDYENKKIIAQAQAPVDMIAENDGTREQKAEWYDAALKTCFDKIDHAAKSTIAALGVSGQQHSFVPLDKNGKAVYNVKLWCDMSTAPECEELTKLAGGEKKIISKAGLPMRPGYTAPKIQWLKNHKPKAFAKLRHILLPHNYLNFLLTGAYTAEYGDASGMGVFNVSERKWSPKMCKLISPELESWLPPLIESNAPAGVVSKAAAELYGIPEGALVSSGGGDNMMSAIGTGAVRDGFLTMSLGTSGTLFGFSKTPVIDPTGNLAAFCSSSGGWLPLMCTMNCTVASEEFRALFGLDVRAFDDEAAKAPVGSEGIVILPFFNGERTPNLPNGRASVNGISVVNFKRENLARAALESAIFGMRIGLERFNELGFKAKEIRITGGGAKSPFWQRIAANVMNLPVRVPAGTEAAAMGAAIQALWCLQSQSRAKGAASAGGASAGGASASGASSATGGATSTGKKVSIMELADEHVALEGASAGGAAKDSATIKPDKKEVAAYDKAYAVYSRYLRALSPLYK